ncbi:MAG: GvpL/GvpF family gas vesicle protein [Planctomycetota bacterium]
METLVQSSPATYLYCVSKRGLSLPDTLKGVGEGPLEVITWGGLAGVCSVLPKDGYSPTLQDLFLHKEVVEYVHTLLAVIPMRFSTTLKRREAVVELLQRHSSRLEETLDRLEDMVEISLRVVLEGEERTPLPAPVSGERAESPSGIAYLRQKRQVQEEGRQLGLRAEEVCKVLEQRLRPLITESQLESSGYMSSIYYLVRRDRLEEFERAFGEIRGRLPEKILYSGPWPPYSFVPEFLEVS